ncbi:SNAP receptor [Phlyctochytrium bullatum]|nr:SNAP receptor [Phlyctochytrium bullatum]
MSENAESQLTTTTSSSDALSCIKSNDDASRTQSAERLRQLIKRTSVLLSETKKGRNSLIDLTKKWKKAGRSAIVDLRNRIGIVEIRPRPSVRDLINEILEDQGGEDESRDDIPHAASRYLTLAEVAQELKINLAVLGEYNKQNDDFAAVARLIPGISVPFSAGSVWGRKTLTTTNDTVAKNIVSSLTRLHGNFTKVPRAGTTITGKPGLHFELSNSLSETESSLTTPHNDVNFEFEDEDGHAELNEKEADPEYVSDEDAHSESGGSSEDEVAQEESAPTTVQRRRSAPRRRTPANSKPKPSPTETILEMHPELASVWDDLRDLELPPPSGELIQPEKVKVKLLPFQLEDVFNEAEEELYESLYSDSRRQFSTYVAANTVLNNYASIFSLLSRMRLAVASTIVCGICQDEAEDPIISKCKHIFCREDIRQYMLSVPEGQKCHSFKQIYGVISCSCEKGVQGCFRIGLEFEVLLVRQVLHLYDNDTLPPKMSFADVERGAGRVASPRSPALALSTSSSESSADQAGDDSRKIWDRASHAIFMISNNVASIQKLVMQLGTPKDTADMRQRLHVLTEDTREMIKQTSGDLKRLVSTSGFTTEFDARQRKIAQQKLQKDFEDVLKRFQSVSKLAAQKSREYVDRAKVAGTSRTRFEPAIFDIEEDSNETAPLMGPSSSQLQELRALDNEIDFNEALIQEREEDLRNIEKSIIEVNEIFRDLGTIVNEQQYMLDNIESNVGEVAINMENAHGELGVAARYQRILR